MFVQFSRCTEYRDDTDFSFWALFKGVLLLIAISIGLFIFSTAARSQSFPLDYDYTPVDKHQCLPLEGTKRPAPYITQVFDEVGRLCNFERLSDLDKLEYLVVILGVSTPNPATPALFAYGGAKMSKRMKNCVAQAMLNKATGLRESDKEVLRRFIGDIEAAKDWGDYVKGIPDLSEKDRFEEARDLVEGALDKAKGEENSETIREYLISSYETGARATDLLTKGQTLTLLEDYDTAVKRCQYEDAGKLLEEIEVFAHHDCRESGWQLRDLEGRYIALIRNNRSLFTSSHGSPQADDASYIYNQLILPIKDRLKREIQRIDDLEVKKRDLKNDKTAFERQQLRYEAQLELASDALTESGICQAISHLQKRLDLYSAQCQEEFLKGLDKRLAHPGTLFDRLGQIGRERSAQWWQKAQTIQSQFQTCKKNEAEQSKSLLLAEIAANPIYGNVAGECKAVPQDALRSHLTSLKEPKHCQNRAVPDVSGLSVSDAWDVIYEAGLVPGDVDTLVNPDGKWQTGVVIETVPPEGTFVPPNTSVAIFAAGKPTEIEEPETAIMPEVIGKNRTDASARINAVGLVASPKEGTAANEKGQTEGNVYAASEVAGQPVPLGQSVTLTFYSARTHGTVPAISGLSLDEARGAIEGAGFVASGPSLGEAAPEGQETGTLYATNPEAESLQPLGQPVEILVYGPSASERNVPDVSGLDVQRAIGVLIGEDGFFSIAGIDRITPVPDDAKPGMVVKTSPAANSLQSKGTTITIHAYASALETADNEEDGQEGEDDSSDIQDENGSSQNGESSNLALTQSETSTGEDQSLENDGLYGYWKVRLTKPKPGRLDYSVVVIERKSYKVGTYENTSGSFLEYWGPSKTGELKRALVLPVMIDGNTVRTDVARFEAALKKSQSKKGGSSTSKKDFFGLGKMFESFFEMLKTLSISQNGDTCTIRTFSKKKGWNDDAVACEKLPDSYRIPGREELNGYEEQ
ncbi:PASTA domain-containing protein [Cohaesibacter haloalkalitolerans]|uniref:PASTA domain-containing protein n=1 Tax=Cohaesibacter haloalkalitolerans TaxID=1162980 RepID=UPI0013C52EB0|nr:PASTA domain-containing protein [Cohaesibacter haloalkalitolerans]